MSAHTLLAIIFWCLSAALAIFVLVEHFMRKQDLISLRNFFLLGFILFQTHSAALGLYLENTDPYPVDRPVESGAKFLAMASLFLVVFLFAYRKGWLVIGLARKFPTSKAVPSTVTLMMLAIVMSLIAVPLRFALLVPVIGVVSSIVAVGFAAISNGLVGWVWGRRLTNPFVAIIGVLVLAMNIGTVIVQQFGRRPLVAVLAALLWGMYFSHWRYLPPIAMLRRLVLIGTAGVIVLALFSAVRGHGAKELSVGEMFRRMSRADLTFGLELLAGGQQTAAASLWAIENYPHTDLETRHLMTIRYMFLINIPRMWWPNKPFPLSSHVVKYARIGQVSRNITLPPGILGYAAAEGGWYAVVVYAVVLALFLRFFDALLVTYPYSPFVVMPIGCALGQVVGLPRGDTSAFANTIVLTFLGTWLFMIAIGKVVEMTAVSRHIHRIEVADTG